jgi:hypothetical protein
MLGFLEQWNFIFRADVMQQRLRIMNLKLLKRQKRRLTAPEKDLGFLVLNAQAFAAGCRRNQLTMRLWKRR